MSRMAGGDDVPIIIGSDDEFSDNDDVIVTKIEIEVDSEDVIFLSETKAPPKLESELATSTSSNRASILITSTGGTTKPPSLHRSTSVTTETGRLTLEDVKETTNYSIAVTEASRMFCSAPEPLDLSAKNSGPDMGNQGSDVVVVSKSTNQIHSCDMPQLSFDGQGRVKFLDESLIPMSSGPKALVDTEGLSTTEILSIITSGSPSDNDTSRNSAKQNISQLPSVTTPSSEIKTSCNNDDKSSMAPLYHPRMSTVDAVCNGVVSCNTQQSLLCKTHVKSPSPAHNSSPEGKNCENIPYPGQTTSVITHSSMAGSSVMTHSSTMAGSTTSSPVPSVTTNVTFVSASSITSSAQGTAPSKSDPFATSHLLLSSLNSQWPMAGQPRSVFHPTSTSCCLQTSDQSGIQTCAHGCQPKSGICDSEVSQSGHCIGGLPGGSMTSLKNNPLKRSLSTSDKTCMYNSLTLPLSMQNQHLKHSCSLSSLVGVGNSASGLGLDLKPPRYGAQRGSALFSDNAIPLPPKKQKRCFSQDGHRKLVCTNCMAHLVGDEYSQCPYGHSSCSKCLKERVKLVLSGKEKESIKCLNRQCDSYYPISELKLSLSPFVVEILEEKLDCEMIVDMMMKNIEPGTESEDMLEKEPVPSLLDNAIKTEKFLKKYEDMPESWDPVEERVLSKNGYELVRLEPKSPEYDTVVAKFFESMIDSNAEVVHVHRLQNPIQWKYYTVKKAEMTQDNDGFGCVEEQQLFHGTNSSVVEAICRKGFDWRLCGKHGTMYGQGSYFAVNASYSHQYTDLRQSKKMSSVTSTMMTANPFSMTLPTQPSLIYPPVNVNFGQFPNPISMSQNSAFSVPNLSQTTGSPSNPTGLPQGNVYPKQPGSNILQSTPQHNTNSNSTTYIMPKHGGLYQYGQPVPGPSGTQQTGNQNNGGKSSLSVAQSLKWKLAKFRVTPKPVYNQKVSGMASVHVGRHSDCLESPRQTAKMFLAKVLVGKYVGGETKYRKPPPLEPKSDPFGKCYDSCVDDIRNPKIFVIFDSAQAYPEYLLEYTYM